MGGYGVWPMRDYASIILRELHLACSERP
uniref:Uncharacterized protein n=1 Tax=Rhizophora mucronata TaxID=61149 RepID=A0A2P2JBP8_RHIMU